MRISPQSLTPAANPQTAADDATLIFLHITKTAGTTLKSILKDQFDPRTIATIQQNLNHPDFNDILYDDFVKLAPAQKNRIRFMRGHFAFGIHEHLVRPFKYITMFRDPIERAVSWYYFVKQNPDSEDYKRFVVNSDGFEDFVGKGYGGTNSQMRVLLTREQLKKTNDDKELLKVALNNIEKYFTVFGFAEKFDESLIHFKRTLGWKYLPVYTSRNITASRPRVADLPQSTIDVVKERNWADILMYEHAMRLFKARISAENDAFTRELDKLRLLKQVFSSGVMLSVQGNYQQALELFKTGLQIEPDSPDLHREIGQLFFKSGDYANALQSFVRVVELNPYDAETLSYCIALLEKFGKISEAQTMRRMLQS